MTYTVAKSQSKEHLWDGVKQEIHICINWVISSCQNGSPSFQPLVEYVLWKIKALLQAKVQSGISKAYLTKWPVNTTYASTQTVMKTKLWVNMLLQTNAVSLQSSDQLVLSPHLADTVSWWSVSDRKMLKLQLDVEFLCVFLFFCMCSLSQWGIQNHQNDWLENKVIKEESSWPTTCCCLFAVWWLFSVSCNSRSLWQKYRWVFQM